MSSMPCCRSTLTSLTSVSNTRSHLHGVQAAIFTTFKYQYPKLTSIDKNIFFYKVTVYFYPFSLIVSSETSTHSLRFHIMISRYFMTFCILCFESMCVYHQYFTWISAAKKDPIVVFSYYVCEWRKEGRGREARNMEDDKTPSYILYYQNYGTFTIEQRVFLALFWTSPAAILVKID